MCSAAGRALQALLLLLLSNALPVCTITRLGLPVQHPINLCFLVKHNNNYTTNTLLIITPAFYPSVPTSLGLRYHPERHVRCLAAETLGYLLRQAPPRCMRAALRALLAEHAVRPGPQRAHGAGLLVGEALLGPEHGVHSRTGTLLGLLLQRDLLTVGDFAAAGARHAERSSGDGLEQQQAGSTPQGKHKQQQQQQQQQQDLAQPEAVQEDACHVVMTPPPGPAKGATVVCVISCSSAAPAA
jgi:hypothetical protein